MQPTAVNLLLVLHDSNSFHLNEHAVCTLQKTIVNYFSNTVYADLSGTVLKP